MALDDGYIYPTVVAITSIMENAKKSTSCDFYIMHPSEFQKENKDILNSLMSKYKGCKINLIDMGDKYKNANDRGHITTPTYYRLSLSTLLPDIDKIIWMDGDTLTFNDLTEMYNIDMDGYYYRGFLDENVNGLELFGIEDDHYICAGVMLINLKKLREDNMVETFEKFIIENNDRLIQHDQTVINAVCYKNIGKLPPKFGMFNYYAKAKDARSYSNVLVASDKYTPNEMEKAFNELVILHCVCKPWKSLDVAFADTWIEYAKKTGLFNEMCEKYPVLKIKL